MSRKAIVTGSDSGIGKATAVALAGGGGDVGVTWHVDRAGAEETVAEVEGLGRRVEVQRLDLLEQPVAGDVIDELADALGGVDVLVNNAGTGHGAPFLDHGHGYIEAMMGERWAFARSRRRGILVAPEGDRVAQAEQWRIEFDAEVTFTNGGGLRARGFRLDVPDRDIQPDAVGELFVRHLGLLMVEDVRVTNARLLREEHKGSRGTTPRPHSRRLVDLSHPVVHGMVTYPGLPGPEITDHLTREASHDHYAAGTEFHIGRISMVANTGTYLDTPFHRFDGGADLSGVALETVADLQGVVVRVTGAAARAIDRPALVSHDVRGKAVLLHTGWDRHWGTDAYTEGHPYLTADGAAWLVDAGAALVGIDSLNIDDTEDLSRPAHTRLLAAGIPVVEHLRGLERLPPSGFRFHAAPVAVVGMGTFPVRAYAVLGV